MQVRRILKELYDLEKEPIPNITIEIKNNSCQYLSAKIEGPINTPYEGGIFHLDMYLPNAYPLVPPKVDFITKIYHPNIDHLGRVCLNSLKDDWNPVLQIRTILTDIRNLMSDPNPGDPLEDSVAAHWIKHPDSAKEIARCWCKKYAIN